MAGFPLKRSWGKIRCFRSWVFFCAFWEKFLWNGNRHGMGLCGKKGDFWGLKKNLLIKGGFEAS